MTLASALAVLVAVILLGFGYAGMAPWSRDLPGFHPTHNAVGSTISYASALQVATAVASGATGGPWAVMDAAGVDSVAPIQFPGMGNTSGGSVSTSGCGSGGPASPFVLPASTGPLGHGLAAAWLFQLQNSVGDILGVAVLNGAGSVVLQTTGSNCSSTGVTYSPIAGNVIDSTSAAGIANSWGGGAFLANYSASIAIYVITGTVSVHQGWYNFPPPNNTSVGNGTPTPSPAPPAMNYTYTSPSLWMLLDSTCSPFASGPGPTASFMASIAPVNGTVMSASAYLSYGECYGYLSSPTPPGPVYGSGGGFVTPF